MPQLFPAPGGALYALLLPVLALALIFVGGSVIKALAFLVVGLTGAAFGLVAGGTVLKVAGLDPWAILGFVVGSLIGLLLVYIGMG